jgi:3-dehydroquinate dehydratase II
VRILLVHGPNLSQLGHRDAAHYGDLDLAALVERTRAAAAALGAELDHFQSEHEGDLVARLHAARTDGTAAVLINAGALTHYSHAIRDALEMLTVPRIEVHLSNVHAREAFRRLSVLAPACDGSIAGLGPVGYELAVRGALELSRARG